MMSAILMNMVFVKIARCGDDYLRYMLYEAKHYL